LDRFNYKEEVEQCWWQQFVVQVGGVDHVVYPGLKKAGYRIGKVSRLFPDSTEVVRTLEVKVMPGYKRTNGDRRYTVKDLETMILPVQRITLLRPVINVNTDEKDQTELICSPVVVKDYCSYSEDISECGDFKLDN